MEAVYQLKPDELNEEFLQRIKDFFGNQEIKITIEVPHDETAYLMQDEEYRKKLLERIESVKRGVVKHTLTIEEIEAMAK